MVPMLTCGLVRSNFAFATGVLLKDFLCSYARAGCADAVYLDAWVLRRFASGPVAGSPDGHRKINPRSPSQSSPLDSGRAPLLGPWPAPRCSLPRRLRNDLLRDVRGNFTVGVELHAVVRPALGLRP